jgi:hypothetical protein
MDMGNLEAYSGPEYAHVHVFDDVARNWDEVSLWFAALKCITALDDARRALASLPASKLKIAAFDWKTPLGWIRIRGAGADTIDAADTLLALDLGGNDHWLDSVGASSPTRPIGLALDLSGDDVYDGQSATQGAGINGVGILLDVGGNDRYQAEYYAQGVGQFGLGALIDLAGDDTYSADHSAQGSAMFCGVGLLADAGGSDHYQINADGQGYGGPGGVGMLADRTGNDVYRAEPDAQKSGRPSYSSNHSASSAQGAGVGWYAGRTGGHSWAGGLGALVDIEGADRYVAGNWSQGMGYWFGTGLLYDGNGSDQYQATSRAQAMAAHYGIGVLLDEGGDDVHDITDGPGLGMAHDVSVALFLGTGGNDRYTIKGGGGFGKANMRSPAALFIDVGGDDTYRGEKDARPGFSDFESSYLADDAATGSVADNAPVIPEFAYMSSVGLFLDVGGNDDYWGGVTNGAAWSDAHGSSNWRARSIGVGMDVPDGVINWLPLRPR